MAGTPTTVWPAGTSWFRVTTAPAPTIAVNLSVRQLQSPRVVTDVVAALADTGLHPGALCLELTETALVHDTDHAAAMLRCLRGLGVRLAVDDFGTTAEEMHDGEPLDGRLAREEPDVLAAVDLPADESEGADTPYTEAAGQGVGRLVELEVEDPSRLDDLCEQLLSNPLVEDYEIELVEEPAA